MSKINYAGINKFINFQNTHFIKLCLYYQYSGNKSDTIKILCVIYNFVMIYYTIVN